ncbi:MAG: phosphate ABC transporter permease PstA [Pseudanabaenaceae cyanobacterium bins.68]|nr:phosphate ABC transporter permease PstA [Pseudanabaenaceae cyanobacterium bins.68]
MKIRRLGDLVLSSCAIAAVILAVVPLGAILIYLFSQGRSRLDWQALTSLPPYPGAPLNQGGFGIALAGTATMVSLGMAIALPIGISTALLITEFGIKQPRLVQVVRLATNAIAGLPTIVVGVFVYSTVVLATVYLSKAQFSFSAIAGSVALALVALPVVVRSSEDSLLQVTQDLRLAAYSLGASPWQAVTGVVLPVALPGIITGSLLAIARIAGETAPLLFTASLAQFPPRSLLAPTPSLAVLIYNFATTAFVNQQQLAWTAALVLVGLILGLSLLARTLSSWWSRT